MSKNTTQLSVGVVGYMDIEDEIFDVAAYDAWILDGAHALVCVETVLETWQHVPLLQPEKELQQILDQAAAMGIGDLVFNRVEQIA